MPVLLSSKDLILGNGDLVLASTFSSLPTIAAYKSAYNNGTLAQMSGILGAIKGTVEVHLVREILSLEISLPQVIAAQQVVREGCHLKCKLAELSLANIQAMLGLPSGNFSETSNGAQQVTSETHTVAFDSVSGEGIAVPFNQNPVLFTGSTPPATANPVITNTATSTTADTGGTGFDASNGTTGTITASNSQIVAGCVIKIGTEQILVGGVSGTTLSTLTRGYNSTTAAVHASGSTVTVLYAINVDYNINVVTDTLTPLETGHMVSGGILNFNYYYLQYAIQTLTGGGQASITNTSIGFYHPYASNNVSMFGIRIANPVGTVMVPYPETTWGEIELEFKGISDFTQAPGAQLWSYSIEVDD